MQTSFEPDYEDFRGKLNNREALNLRATVMNLLAAQAIPQGRLYPLDLKGPKPFKVYVWLAPASGHLVFLGACWDRPGEPAPAMLERMLQRVRELNTWEAS